MIGGFIEESGAAAGFLKWRESSHPIASMEGNPQYPSYRGGNSGRLPDGGENGLASGAGHHLVRGSPVAACNGYGWAGQGDALGLLDMGRLFGGQVGLGQRTF